MTTSKTKMWRWGKMVLILAGLFAILWTGLDRWARHRERQARLEIDRRLNAIRSGGAPVTAEELAAIHPSPPAEKDAGQLLAGVLARFEIPDEVEDLLREGVAPLRAELGPVASKRRDKLEAFLQTNQAVMASIPWHQLTNAWIGAGYEHGFPGGPVYKISPLLQLARAFFISAVLESEAGQGSNALVQIRRGLILSRTLRSDTFLHHLGRRVLEQEFCSGLEHVLARKQVPPEALLELDVMLADESTEDFRMALKAMRCWDISFLERMRSGTADDFMPQGFTKPTPWESAKANLRGKMFHWSGRFYCDEDFTRYLDLSEQSLAVLTQPAREWAARFGEIANQRGNKESYRTLSGQLFDFYQNGAISNRAIQDLEIVARVRVARTAMAIQWWSIEHGGGLPDSLALLVPNYLSQIPSDPFDGLPIRYRKLAAGFVVYSVGWDFADNGGTGQIDEMTKDAPGDITFKVEP